MISAFSIHLTLLKTWNRVYKCWVRPELQHDVINILAPALLQSHDVVSHHECLTYLKMTTHNIKLLAVASLRPSRQTGRASSCVHVVQMAQKHMHMQLHFSLTRPPWGQYLSFIIQSSFSNVRIILDISYNYCNIHILKLFFIFI